MVAVGRSRLQAPGIDEAKRIALFSRLARICTSMTWVRQMRGVQLPTPLALAASRSALLEYAISPTGAGYPTYVVSLCNALAACVRVPPHDGGCADALVLDHDPVLVRKMAAATKVITVSQYTTGTVSGVGNCARGTAFNDMQVADLKRRGVLGSACTVESMYGQRAPVGCLQGTKAKAVMKELADEGVPVTAHAIRAGCVQADVLIVGWHHEAEIGSVLPTTTYAEMMESAIVNGTPVFQPESSRRACSLMAGAEVAYTERGALHSTMETSMLARHMRDSGAGFTPEGLQFAQLAVCTVTGCSRNTPQGSLLTYMMHAAHDVPRSTHSALHTTMGTVGVASADTAAAHAALAEAENDLGDIDAQASSLNDSDAMALAVHRVAHMLDAAVAQCRMMLNLLPGFSESGTAVDENTICAASAALAAAAGAMADGAIGADKLRQFTAMMARTTAEQHATRLSTTAVAAAVGPECADSAPDAAMTAACGGLLYPIEQHPKQSVHLMVCARRLSPAHIGCAVGANFAALDWQDVTCGQINEQRMGVPPVAAAAGMAPRATVHAGAYAGGGPLKVEVVDALLQPGTQPHATRVYQPFVPPAAAGGMAPAAAPITGAGLALRLVNHAAMPGCVADLVVAEASRLVRCCTLATL